ncbi:MAG: hypothetical protein JNK74_13485 [Candidatus Hydrogenedentes bacterium]|nr:hypothetical protein [Candidatus Hydrogenedentota bacterium]
MNCKRIQREMDAAFDAGVTLDATAAEHARMCPDCGAHLRALGNLDGALRAAPPVQPAPALVARIQDCIAAEPVRQPRPWLYPLATAASVLVLAALGRIAHSMFPTTGWVRQAWLPQEPLLPDWAFLKEELLGIPVAVAGDMAVFSEWAGELWRSVNLWEMGPLGGDNPWVWVLFGACAATAFALDGMEWMSRRFKGPGH